MGISLKSFLRRGARGGLATGTGDTCRAEDSTLLLDGTSSFATSVFTAAPPPSAAATNTSRVWRSAGLANRQLAAMLRAASRLGPLLGLVTFGAKKV